MSRAQRVILAGMTNVIPLSPAAEHRSVVIGEVRAVMGRRRVNASELGRRTGRPQQYWSRRLTGLTALDVDDLATLAAILEVPMSDFVPEYRPPSDPEPGRGVGGGSNFIGVTPIGPRLVGRTGLEPVTDGLWVGEADLAPVVDLASRISSRDVARSRRSG